MEESQMMKQYNDLKAKHQEAILLFRCGDFYETYCDDAKICAKELGITLTYRNGDKMPMAGFPYHALDAYLPKLIRNGHRVAICDMLPEPPKPKVGESETNKISNNSKSKIMEKNFKAADLIGKTIVVGNNQATIEINGIDGDKLSGVFSKDGKNTPMSFPFSQLKGMIDKGLWRISDGSEEKPTVAEVKTEADVAEVDDIVPKVTPKPTTAEIKTEEDAKPTEKMEPVKPKKQEKPKKSQPSAVSIIPVSKYRVVLLPTKDGKQWPKLYGFKDENEAKKIAAKMAKTVKVSWDRDEQGEKRYFIGGGKKYCEVFQTLADALNAGDKDAISKAQKASVAIFEGATADGKAKREERKAERASTESKPKVEKPAAKTEKTYTQSELAEWLRKLNAGDPKAAKFFNDLAKAA